MLRKAPRLLKALHVVLTTFEANVQHIALRVLASLCTNNYAFKEQVAKHPILTRIVYSLSSSNHEVSHWGVSLVHDIANTGRPSTDRLVRTQGEFDCVDSVRERVCVYVSMCMWVGGCVSE